MTTTTIDTETRDALTALVIVSHEARKAAWRAWDDGLAAIAATLHATFTGALRGSVSKAVAAEAGKGLVRLLELLPPNPHIDRGAMGEALGVLTNRMGA